MGRIVTGEQLILRRLDGHSIKGTVDEIAEEHGVFWIIDHLGTRQLVLANDLASMIRE
ncbi:hypothetical protein LVY72_14320 [Arthrobacter sp. I2-34]|uniref:DUF2642 domain-containing protein n=1 Tax=Arthrobacter hankyongi TaxID=2904801 RepID=A0ABS9L8W0_9MICC|nr:hypothetical protein [Arthrobacter hankyongi]MCG2623075.1 hypothetical protein [Arthrobacter hankyongi]